MAPPKGFQKDVYQVFRRIPYGKPLSAEMFQIHGYPSVEIDVIHPSRPIRYIDMNKWNPIKAMLDEHFRDEHGNSLSCYTPGRVFFLTEDDAHLFRSLLLLI
ncbi:hypothetical protein [Brucella anthropi]|uniref:hypothetical protein n=1 Tax=Brucella anthropi TaxID=529 RepID=UPI000F662B5A|nr:hypothetical protein [Brucella anthropi]